MKRFFAVLSGLLLALAVTGRAQDLATLDERVKRMSGYIQDLQEENANQKKQIEALVKEITSLREHQQALPTTATASQDDLRELTRKVQEIEEKRKADRAFLEKEFDRLFKAANAKPPVPRSSSNDREADAPAPNLPKDAREHTIASGDTLLAIALAYSKDTGKKITTDLILKANPGLKAERLIPGNKIVIPVPDK